MRRKATFGLFLAALAALPAAAAALEVSYELGLYSDYVWRGITLTDGPVFQPGVEITHRSGFTFSLWGNLDIADDNDNAGDLNELDLTFAYAWTVERLEITVGLIEYTFPNTPFAGTREAVASLAWNGPISPRLTVFYDFVEYQDVYANLALELGAELSRRWTFTAAVSAGYAGADFAIGANAGLHDGNLKLDLAYGGKTVSLDLVAAYTESLDEDVLLEQPVHLWGGLYLTLDF